MTENDESFGNTAWWLSGFTTVLLLYILTRRRTGVPPGPLCWPIIGNIYSFFGKDPITSFQILRRTYGDIYGVYIGTELVVVLNGFSAIHEAMVKKGRTFARRPVSRFSRLMLKDASLVFENGIKWKKHRQFAVQALHELCFSENGVTMEERVHEELDYFLKELGQYSKPVDISTLITLSLANVMYNIIFGRRAGYENEKFRWYVELQRYEHELFCRNQVLHNCFPFLIHLPGDVLNARRAKGISEKLKMYFNELCAENFKNFNEGDRECLVDIWLSTMHESPWMQEENLWKIINELLSSGSETTATTLKWIILCLTKYPDLQTRLRKEVDDKLGDSMSSMRQRKDMPFTNAVIYEALRIGSIAPLALPHSVPYDVMFQGFLIPKNTTILPNISSVNFDPEIFPDPYKFKPERFLSEDGQSVLKSEKLIPFSLGPRSCLGETVAMAELFLYLTTLMQNFEFRAAESEPLPSLAGTFGLTNHPQEFKVQVVRR